MSKELPPSRTAEQFVVRFPEGMRDRIAEAAKAAGRSMNAEIVQRLEQSFERAHAAHVQAGGAELEPTVKLAISGLEFTKDMLARLLAGVLELVPEGERSERLVVIATQIAKGIELKDEDAFRKGLALLLHMPELVSERAKEAVPDPTHPGLAEEVVMIQGKPARFTRNTSLMRAPMAMEDERLAKPPAPARSHKAK
ncbi:MAG: Arc family DNA-binding protein [Hydrogenophaga sp.]|uniref:Arc family DNA-binding protein n=1 Tax=Hydrogenophaga sp. TaxID=1904254 RepID=UPI0027356CE9|nr:Arc family DNA-binding protein [Hydrogenophaga sp.]MDP3627110.1 Arc family DNA-binding protein [Hydrogenophaga sp.]